MSNAGIPINKSPDCKLQSQSRSGRDTAALSPCSLHAEWISTRPGICSPPVPPSRWLRPCSAAATALSAPQPSQPGFHHLHLMPSRSSPAAFLLSLRTEPACGKGTTLSWVSWTDRTTTIGSKNKSFAWEVSKNCRTVLFLSRQNWSWFQSGAENK